MSVETNESQLQDALFDVSSEPALDTPETTWEDLRAYVDGRSSSRQFSDLSKEQQQQVDREIDDLVDKGYADYGEATAQVYERHGLELPADEGRIRVAGVTPQAEIGVAKRTVTCGDCGAEISNGHGCMHMRISRAGKLIPGDHYLFNSRRTKR